MIPIEPYTLELLESSNYRDFLKKAFAIWERTGHPVTYSAFSRRAGLSSRSFPRDVLRGEKRLTEQSLPGFIQALGLRGELRAFFTLLVARDENLRLTDVLSSPDARGELVERKRARMKARLEETELPLEQALTVLRSERQTLIFAALGTLKDGATLEKIGARIGLERALLEPELQDMALRKLIRYEPESGRAWPVSTHLDLTGQSRQQDVRDDFVRSTLKLKRRAQEGFASTEELFFQSVFSVDQARMPELKRALRDVLLRFSENGENPDGNRVARIVTGLFYEG